MKYMHSFLALATTATLLSITGCNKQESSTAQSAEKPASASLNAEKTQPVETSPKPAVAETVAPAKSDVTPAPVAAVAIPKPAVESSTTKTPAAAESTPVSASAATLQSTLQAQKLAFGQAVTNQAQAVATAATNQMQALATAVTNRALAALGMTNQANTVVTNQVEALLEKAKILSSNQKYQEALGTVTELYKNKLTPEQKQRADELKTQIQTALTQKATAGASSALGNFLGGKKE